jgi:hypothetical protein
MGTVHGTEVLHLCPDITRDAVVSIADFARRARSIAAQQLAQGIRG